MCVNLLSLPKDVQAIIFSDIVFSVEDLIRYRTISTVVKKIIDELPNERWKQLFIGLFPASTNPPNDSKSWKDVIICIKQGERKMLDYISHYEKNAHLVTILYQNYLHLTPYLYSDNAETQWRIGQCFRDGNGCDKDGYKAFAYFFMAAAQGHARAQIALGNCYEHAIGCTYDNQKAFEYYKMAADQKDSEGLYILGVCYDDGNGCQVDEYKAFECFQKATEQGHADGTYNVGLYYEEGLGGCETNINKAVEYYKYAAKQGSNGAYDRLVDITANQQKLEYKDAREMVARMLKESESSGDEAIGTGQCHAAPVNKDRI